MMRHNISYKKGFLPYALAALLIGLVGGFSTVLGPAFVQDIGIAYNNTTWTALAQAMSTAACAPILGKVGDVIGRRTTLLLGIAVFTLGNILSALANSLLFMMIARFIDAFTDVTMGRICDRSRTRSSGKFKPWILRMCVPVSIASSLIYQSGFSDWSICADCSL